MQCSSATYGGLRKYLWVDLGWITAICMFESMSGVNRWLKGQRNLVEQLSLVSITILFLVTVYVVNVEYSPRPCEEENTVSYVCQALGGTWVNKNYDA